MFHVEH